MNSILEDIKQMLNLEKDYTPFDTDVQIYINSAFGNLYQLGVLTDKYSITGYDETWDDVPLVRKQAQEIKVYIYLYTRLRFDPPANSFVIEACLIPRPHDITGNSAKKYSMVRYRYAKRFQCR